jgi:3-oxoacyl-[acyl-carrier-protein] synthase-3
MDLKVFRPGVFGVGVRIAATGMFVPPRTVTNADLVAAGSPLDEDEILKLSGIEERRHVDGEATSDLAIAACRQALARARLGPESVDRLIVGTVSPDHMSPSTACFVQVGLGLGPVPAFDITASCTAFVYALDLAARSIATGDQAVLAVAADVRSKFIDPEDRATAALFGDGAGAVVLQPGPVGAGLLGIGLLADGRGARSVYVPAGGSREPASLDTVRNKRHRIYMEDGPKVYLAAADGMIGTAEALLASLSLGWDDVDLVVPHQPNRRILDRLAKLARIAPDKVIVNITRYGNMSGASCAVALDEALRQRARAGHKVLIVAAGAGYTAGAALLEVDDALLAACRGQIAG